MLIYVIVGGTASIAGPIVGASVMTVLADALRELGLHYDTIGYGLALILIMLFLPGGLISLPQRVRRTMGRSKKAKPLEVTGV